ncbi:MAG: alkaline phosphatase family protein, partial [Novosphingobium sp.]|nr:alkaline phosphatase family protein [Novosphingobium sp.]
MTDGLASRRLLMIGLDAISLPFVRDHLESLPNFASLLERGLCHTLKTPGKYMSAATWPTFASGLQPGEHGHYYPFQWNAEKQSMLRFSKPIWSSRYRYEPFWHPVARQGVPTIAFDIPYAIFDDEPPCMEVSHWSYQSTGVAHTSDPELLRDVRRRFGRRPMGTEVQIPKTARQCATLRDRQIQAAASKGDAILYMLDKPWRLFLTGFYEVHRAGHNLWPVEGEFASKAAPDALLAVYREIDRQLGRIIGRVEQDDADTSLLLFALHGMEPNRAQGHFLDEIINRLNRRYLGKQPKQGEKAKPLNVMAFLRSRLPSTLQYRLTQLLGEDIQDWVVNRALLAGRDWQQTPSFALTSGGEGFIRLNIKGREREGFFEPGSTALQDYLDWLRARLAEIRVAATGEPLIDEILLADERFPGARS